LDADRLDYLMRDSYNTAIQFGNVDIQNLISAMRITVIGQKYSVAMDEANLSMVEDFLFGRFKMYETVYYNGYKLFSEELLQRIFKRVATLMEGDKTWVEEMRCSPEGNAICDILQGKDLKVSEYLLLDDVAVEAQFTRWLKRKQGDPILTRLVQAFLQRNQSGGCNWERAPVADRTNHEIFRRIRVFHEKDEEIQDLLRQIEALLRREGASLLGPREKLEDVSHAFINVFRCCKMYSGSLERQDDDNNDNIIWILRENGTVEDIGKVSRMLDDEFHKSYLYYCEDIFWEELKHCQFSEGTRNEAILRILNGVKEWMETAHPRNMIEIEEKYSCDQQTLNDIRSLLQKYTEVRFEENEGFYLKQFGSGEVLEMIEQEDTYFDLEGSRLDREVVSDEELLRLLKPILTIKNCRRKGIVYRCEKDERQTPFKAEICLDSVFYKRSPDDPDAAGKLDWQIELELKSDYLDRILLRKFTNLLRNQGGLSSRLKPESASKCNKARQLLGLSQDA